MSKFCDRLRELREEKKLSQQELSKLLQDISQSAIAKWELGKTQPKADSIIAIAKLFNVSTDYLLGLNDF